MKKIYLKKELTPQLYLQMLNGIFNLTPKEIEVAQYFLKEHWKGNYPFSVDVKKHIANELNFKSFYNLNTYLNKFVNKKLIVNVSNGYVFNSAFNKDNEGIAFIWKKEN